MTAGVLTVGMVTDVRGDRTVLIYNRRVVRYAEGDDAINYAQAAHAAAMLVNKSVEDLDSVRTRPMIEELVLKTGMRLEDSAVPYWR